MKKAILIFGCLGGLFFIIGHVLSYVLYYSVGYLFPIVMIMPAYLSIRYVAKVTPSAKFGLYFNTGMGTYALSYVLNFIFLAITTEQNFFGKREILVYLFLLGIGVVINLIIANMFRSRYESNQFKNRRW